MKIRVVVRLILLSLALNSVPVIAQTHGQGMRKPNVIVILADDLGYGDVGAYGDRKSVV